MDYKKYFKGKKITVMGLGLLGRGVGDAAFLASCGAKLTVTDLKPKEQLQSSLNKLERYRNIKYVLGRHELADFRRADMVLKAAGVPSDSPFIVEAKRNGIPVRMSVDLFAELSGIPCIGVTGTRGKSTVAYLIHHILECAGKKALLGGNVVGVSTLASLPHANKYDYAVLELDSWQLQGFGDNHISPHIAVFTTFLPDHMNYYKNDMKAYFKDKANIFKNQKKDDVLIAGMQAMPFIKKWGGKRKSKTIVAGDRLPRGWTFPLPGEHNEYNACLAVEAARALGIPDGVIKKALLTFRAVPGRLELVRTVRGIRIYNDTNSTTPDATLVALKALSDGRVKKIHLVMGGADKQLDMKKLVRAIPKYCKSVTLLAGTGTDTWKAKIRGEVYADLKTAVNAVFTKAKKGDIVLLSPAFASFGMFKNEYDRGDQFNAIVKKLK